ncbi:MAG TPA: RHS repeat-associated core domain-containing protein, partial [Phenylobacterium sp.]|nr:RHS repeat-associated core domain-containing protein [Phenylobacterium sp.]
TGVATSSALNPNTSQPEAYDFKGNLLRSTRQFVSDYRSLPDWGQAPALDPEIFTSSVRYNAINRPIQNVAPYSSLPGARLNIIQSVFNAANLLERVDVWLDRASEPTGLLDPAVDAPSRAGVSNLDYDAKGQRQRIDYKNGASTRYDYDPFTFRLARLRTRRDAGVFPGDNPQPPPAGWPGGEIQDLSYVYDPAGNIVHLQDDAQQGVYFNNRRVEPSNDYTYDAIHRLIESTGREHLGRGGSPATWSHDDAGSTGLLSGDAAGAFSPNDGNAMGAYLERYVYDAMGNFLEMQHRRTDAASPGWTRTYRYSEASLIENGAGGSLLKTSNRLSSTTVGGNVEAFEHDVHGNMVRMPHLGGGLPGRNLQWDFNGRLLQADLGGGGRAYHGYSPDGQRVRKVWEKSASLIEERIYLGGFEIFRRHRGPIGVNTATLERETLHVMDDKHRIALVETRTLDLAGSDTAPAQLIRYQLGNHLGSASLELDDSARIISYEEYTPYGSSSYQAVRSQTDTPKRYRHTGKERDEETGLSYHGARYYAPWLGRWTASDPSGLADGFDTYLYCHADPVRLFDPDGRSGMTEERYRAGRQDMTPDGPTDPDAFNKTLDSIVNPSNETARGVMDAFADTGEGMVEGFLDDPLGTWLATIPGTPQFYQSTVVGTVAAVEKTGEAAGTVAYAAANPTEAGQDYAVGRAVGDLLVYGPQVALTLLGLEGAVAPKPNVPKPPPAQPKPSVGATPLGAGPKAGGGKPGPIIREVNTGTGTQMTPFDSQPLPTCQVNCAFVEGALLEGKGAGSTHLARRAGLPEGDLSLPQIKTILGNEGVSTGPTLYTQTASAMEGMLSQLPPGSQALVSYVNP